MEKTSSDTRETQKIEAITTNNTKKAGDATTTDSQEATRKPWTTWWAQRAWPQTSKGIRRNSQVKPSLPRLPRDQTRALSGGRTNTPNLHEELRSLLQAPDLVYSSESSLCSCESGPNTDEPMEDALTTR